MHVARRGNGGSFLVNSAVAVAHAEVDLVKTLLVILAEEGLAAIPWAHRITSVAGSSLCIVCPTKGTSKRLQEIGKPDEETSELARAAFDAANGADFSLATVYESRAHSVYRAVLDAARELAAQQLVLHAALEDNRDGVNATVRQLARGAPYDVLVLDTAGRVDPPARTIVPQLGGGGSHAIAFAARYFGDEQRPIKVLQDENARHRSERVFHKAVHRLGEKRGAYVSRLDTALPIEEALTECIQTGDLILMEADKAGQVPRLLAKLAELRAERQDVKFTVGITRAEHAAGAGRLGRVVERIRRHAPVLTREQRRDLHERLEQGGKLSTDFVVMLTLSAAIAALGLIQSSTAVVIGAMLVAPLMTPLVAIGMALAQGNRRLFQVALRAMSFGVLGGLMVSMAVGLLSPWDDLSAEVVARCAPNVFDLAIALLSGMAASFALARPGLAGTLVGVAIAVALVPPLAVIGIAGVKLEFALASGAAVLFSTNLLAIALGSAVVFRLFGVDPAVRGAVTPAWVRTTLLLVTPALLAITALLAFNLSTQMGQGVYRPYARPLPSALRTVLRERLAQEAEVEVIFMMESGIEHGFGLEIALASPGPISAELLEELHAIIAEHVGPDREARILTLQATGAE
jgi:uncharacterized hydrophobic protein (TIGR00271 family)